MQGLAPLGSPPSTYAAYDVVTGKPGGIPRMIGMTLLRAALITPGLYVAGIRDTRTVLKASTYASIGISAFVLGYTWWNENT